MAEYDPWMPYTPIDMFPVDEFIARDEALQALIEEATELRDDYKLEIYQAALAELIITNPGRGAHYRSTEVSEIETASHQRQSRGILGRLGLVYGDELSEFGLKHVGLGVPIYRRSSLEKSQRDARALLALVKGVEHRSLPDIQQ